tara:strand:- start:177 stop:953 length:777 start_codon:yes stop_codon:yes gene_type:complete
MSDEEYYDCELNFNDIINKYSNKKALDEKNKKVFNIDYKFLKECKKWGPNRKLDNLHLNRILGRIELKVKKNKNLNLPGIFAVGYDTENDIFVLIDGQHRKTILFNLHKRYDFNCNVNIELYLGDDIYFKEIFEELNYSKPVDTNKLYLDKFLEIKEFFNDKFYNGCRNILRKKTRRPFINEDKLWEELVESSIFMNIHLKKLKKEIININNEYRESIDFSKISLSMMNTMYEYKCFLGLDTEFNWLKQLEKRIKNDI